MPPRKRRRAKPGPDSAYAVPSRRAGSTSVEIDLHGLRVAEARPLILRHLQACHDERLPVARFIHGHGTGAIRSLVVEILSSSPLVASHYPDVLPGVMAAELRYGDGHRAYNRKSNNSIVPEPGRWK